MAVPRERFNELLQDIEPSQTTKTQAANAHAAIRQHLEQQKEFKEHYVSSFLSGSYVRDTSIRPRTSADGQERPDVDIIVVTSFTTSDHPDAVLKDVCRASRTAEMAMRFSASTSDPSGLRHGRPTWTSCR